MCGSGIGAGQAPVGRWQFRGSECGEGKPHSARAVSGSGASEPNRAPVLGRTGAAESHRRAGASAGSSIDHGSRCDLRHQGWDTGPDGLLRQLSDRQPQLRDRRGASDGSTNESGNGGRAGHAHTFHAMARTRTSLGGGRYHLRERGVLTVVGGSEHHALYANPRQCSAKEQSRLWP